MKGSTGTPGSIEKMWPKSFKARRKFQKELSDQLPIVTGLLSEKQGASHKSARIAHGQEKMQELNSLSRNDEMEVVYTLVDGLIPIRHAMLSRTKARRFNYQNRVCKTGMYWVLGRQKIESKK